MQDYPGAHWHSVCVPNLGPCCGVAVPSAPSIPAALGESPNPTQSIPVLILPLREAISASWAVLLPVRPSRGDNPIPKDTGVSPGVWGSPFLPPILQHKIVSLRLCQGRLRWDFWKNSFLAMLPRAGVGSPCLEGGETMWVWHLGTRGSGLGSAGEGWE